MKKTIRSNLRELGPRQLVRSIWDNWFVLTQLVRRNITNNYSGSMLGVLWAVITPIMLLALYTIIFGFVFRPRISQMTDTPQTSDFALRLFCGLIVFWMFADMITKAPVVMRANASLVKKVVFPLDILIVAELGSILFQAGINMLVFLAGALILRIPIGWEIVLTPIVLLPYLMIVLGISWVLAAAGVVLRDVSQLMGMISTLVLFGSPVFYSISALPEKLQQLVYLNPLTFIIESLRGLIFDHRMVDWQGIAIYYVAGMLLMWLGWAFFQKSKTIFADVL